jgi:predicted hydrocarbon binding protein
VNHEALPAICMHRKTYFAQMASLSPDRPVIAEELGCAFKGQDRCTFRLKLA